MESDLLDKMEEKEYIREMQIKKLEELLTLRTVPPLKKYTYYMFLKKLKKGSE